MNVYEKLKKIEALFEGAKTAGERQAAELAKQRVLERLEKERKSNPIEYTVTLGDQWSKRLFVAICNKHGVQTYRYRRQKYTTTMVRVTVSFMNEVLWPEYKKYAAYLEEFISNVTDELISKIHKIEEDVILSGELPGK